MLPVALAVALLLGIIADLLCVLLAGAGHGTYVPAALFFGPLAAFGGNYAPAFVLGPLLYCAYAFYLLRGGAARCAAARGTAVVLVHYVCALLSISQSGEGARDVAAALQRVPLLCLFAAVTFLALNAGGVALMLTAGAAKRDRSSTN